jgi:16S rRNA (guanine527-N7)-methyltransferase
MNMIFNGRDYSSYVASLEKAGLSISEQQLEQFDLYFQMLIEKNKVMNLTAITEFEDVLCKHFLDSVSIYHLFADGILTAEDFSKGRLVDLGTGAGFPGIPLKILFPELRVTLMDSLNKRIVFLQEVIDALHLTSIDAVHGRAEDLARNKLYREQFDFCVSRAVANISTLSEYCLPFVKVGGAFISYKSDQSEEELAKGSRAISTLGGQVKHVSHFTLDNSDLGRALIYIEKEKSTAKKYPRKAGTPSKEPLS